jgi:hypothetical protein
VSVSAEAVPENAWMISAAAMTMNPDQSKDWLPGMR